MRIKDRHGFSLVELLVVMIIIVILAAITAASFKVYIDKANRQADISEARAAVMALQTVCSEAYGEGIDCSGGLDTSVDGEALSAKSLRLAGMQNSGAGYVLAEISGGNKVERVEFRASSGDVVIWEEGEFY